MLTATLPFNGNSFQELSTRVRALKVKYPDHLDADVVELLRSIFTRASERISLSKLTYNDWVMRGYATPPIDYLEFSSGPTMPSSRHYPPNPVLQSDDEDDLPGRGIRVHPLLHLMNHKKAAKRFTKGVVIVDGFAAGEEDGELARVMMHTDD
jgi:hypothetical protein